MPMDDLKGIILKLYEDYEKTISLGTGDAFGKLSAVFEELNSLLREQIQELTQQDMSAIIDKLKNGLTITPQDREQIRLWVVGDAEEYTKSERRFDTWLQELRQVMEEVKLLQEAPANDVAAYSRLRALLREGSRIMGDVFYFLQQKERIEKFKKAVQEMDASERSILIQVLEQKMASPDF